MAGNQYSSHWSDPTLEPKRTHRFILSIGGLSGREFSVKKVNKPSFTIAETPHKFMNWTFWYPGKVEWDPITITMVDPGGGKDNTEGIMAMLYGSGFLNPDTAPTGGLESTVSKHKAVEQLGGNGESIYIKQLMPSTTKGASDVVKETWKLYGAWVQKAVFGELNYDNDTMVEINLTIRYDWATFHKGDTGAAAVGAGDASDDAAPEPVAQ